VRSDVLASAYTCGRTGTQLTLRGDPLIASLSPIPLVDVREGGSLRQAREHSERALALRDTIIASHPPFIRALIPMLDGMARRWLMRSRSPYDEVNAIADLLGLRGASTAPTNGRLSRGRRMARPGSRVRSFPWARPVCRRRSYACYISPVPYGKHSGGTGGTAGTLC
jgi:hypothetical protein